MLSIVIPTFNEEGFLPRLLRSIQEQTFKDFEVIVADAHSTDRTRELALAAGCRVVDGGMPGPGRNFGAAAARGDLILFFDADVVLRDPRFLESFVAELTERNLDVATCRIEPMSDKLVDRVSHGLYNGYITATQNVFPHAHGFCIMARKAAHDAIGGFDETVRLAEDHDYAQRAAREGWRFGIVRTPRIPVSTRRFKRDGYLSIAAKYVLCEMHMLAVGPVKTDIFRYRFGHADDAGSDGA